MALRVSKESKGGIKPSEPQELPDGNVPISMFRHNTKINLYFEIHYIGPENVSTLDKR